jgi:hypothetical protein
MSAFDSGLQRISRLQSEFAPDPTGDDYLPFCGNCRARGKTILRQMSFLQVSGLRHRSKWWDRPDLNRDCRFRKPVLYPFKQRPRTMNFSMIRLRTFCGGAEDRGCGKSDLCEFRG